MADRYGDFAVRPLLSELSDSDEDFLGTIDLETLIQASFLTDIAKEEFENNIHPETSCPEAQPQDQAPKAKRFKQTSSVNLDQLEEQRHSTSTKKNTAWGVKVFQDWHNEVYGSSMDMSTVDDIQLAEVLRRFYCEAAPRVTDSRAKSLPTNQAGEYHTNTLKNIRSAINRHLKDLHRATDIVKDGLFSRANNTLDGYLKTRVQTGTARQTKHKDVLSEHDLSEIAKYFSENMSSPIILRQCIWYIISIHFVSRGIEFHHQLHRDSFVFSKDDSGEFIYLNHQVKEKTNQGGLDSKTLPKSQKRVYATGDVLCPVKLLQMFLDKTDPAAPMLFNQYNKLALENPTGTEIWYLTKPLAKRSFSNFMKDICIGAKLESRYTPHCLRATAIQAMNDAGFEARHIMFMSGHKSEASLRSYNRSCSSKQKKALSSTLGALTVQVPNSTGQLVPVSTSQFVSVSSESGVVSRSDVPTNTSIDVQPQFTQNNNQDISKFEFFAGVHISNCTFNVLKDYVKNECQYKWVGYIT